jgi:hypothetical protein
VRWFGCCLLGGVMVAQAGQLGVLVWGLGVVAFLNGSGKAAQRRWRRTDVWCCRKKGPGVSCVFGGACGSQAPPTVGNTLGTGSLRGARRLGAGDGRRADGPWIVGAGCRSGQDQHSSRVQANAMRRVLILYICAVKYTVADIQF